MFAKLGQLSFASVSCDFFFSLSLRGCVPGFPLIYFFFLLHTAPPLKLVDLPGVDKSNLDDSMVRIYTNIMVKFVR